MKKKILFALLFVVLMLALALSASAAETVTDDESDTLTLGSCTIAGLDGVTIPSPTVGLVYTLDDTTMTAAVSGRGSFGGGDLVFPSSVTYNGKAYAVTKINSNLFQKLTYNLYVPDSITFIGGGSSTGTFGNSTINKIYIGSGLSGFERETFSGSKGFSTFICKSKPTYIGVYAFNANVLVGTREAYEFDLSHVIRFEELAFNGATFLMELVLSENVEFIGSQAFVTCTNLNGSIVVPADCQLNYRCFNGTSLDLVVIKVKEGETFSAPTELFSGAAGGLTVVFDGNAVAGGNYFFSGNSTVVHMPSLAHIEAFVASVATKSGNERMENATFYSCKEGKYYTATKAGVITEAGEADAHYYTSEAVFFEKDCSRYERYSFVCYACGNESVESQGTELGEHVLDVTVKQASCQSKGYIIHICTVCDYEETVHFVDASAHSATVKEYAQKDYKTVTVTSKCEYCNEVVSIEDVSLVNKCFINGYGLFDATMDYVSVSASGVATPSGAAFNNAVIYFPSCVEINGEVVEVNTVQGFKAKSIKSIYIPDSVTRIAGGSGVGCFGDIKTLKNVVVGSGVTSLEQEVFCMGGGASLDEFIFRGTITEMRTLCLSNVNASSASIPYEFNTALVYVGKQVNFNGNILREARIAKGCNLSEKFAFNNANGLKTVYIEGADTPENALDLGQEFTSNTATTALYIKGYVTVSGQAVLSGQNNTRVYMMNEEAIALFTSAIVKYNYKNRLDKTTFMDCAGGTAWFVDQSGNMSVHPTVIFSHGGAYEITNPTCAGTGTSVEKCFICAGTVSSTELEKLQHSFDGGVITKMPTDTKNGTIVYTCLLCGQAREETILVNLGTHKEAVSIYYENGFTQAGYAVIMCNECDHTETKSLEAMFVVHGFSLREDYTGITYGYSINIEAMAYYEQNVGALEYGVILANASDVEANGLLDENNSFIEGNRGFKFAIPHRSLNSLDVKVVGTANAETRALNFLLTAYVIADKDADGTNEIEYLQSSIPNGDNKPITVGTQALNTISIDRAIAALNK